MKGHMIPMHTPHPPTAPATLYALLLQLRPLQRGTLMPFSGELVHGAFLHWLQHAAPALLAGRILVVRTRAVAQNSTAALLQK